MITILITDTPLPGKPRDIPLAWMPLYYWLLHSPHAGKAVDEAQMREDLAKSGEEKDIRARVNVRPSLLVGESRGWGKLRIGTDEEPVRGYFVARQDVGEFVFERVIKQDVLKEWVNGGVHLTQ